MFSPADSPLHTQIQAMPKIDLHRHLEGSLRLETLLSIAVQHNITLPTFNVDGLRPFVQIMPGEPRSWENFIAKFQILRMFYRSETIIRRVTAEVVADAAADNVRYLELRFTPQALNNLLRCDYDQVVRWVCESANETAARHGIQVRLLLSMNRHESVEIGQQVVAAALQHREIGVVGVDLAGREPEFSAAPFRDLFNEARSQGLGITVHAGEWVGADNVREAVEILGATRIGHGIRATEDPAVVALLAERGTVLEVCPTSNVQSGVIDDYAAHPLAALYQAGVKTTINTDDPLISNITLTDEIEFVLQHTTLTLEDIKRQQLIAAEAAFLPAPDRAALVERFRGWLYPTPPAP